MTARDHDHTRDDRVDDDHTRDDRAGADGDRTRDDRAGDADRTRDDRGSGAPPALPEGLLRDYRPIDEIGHGGQGRVIRAERLTDRVIVAIKVYPRARRSREAIDRLRRPELHPHVVDILDVGEDGSVAWEVMEFVDGGSLADLMGRYGESVPGPLVREILAELAAGLVALHQAGITHRDVKPANVLVRTLGPLDLVLADFGGLRAQEHTVEHATHVVQSDRYASLEAVDGAVSAASDWWSVGIIVAELAGGRHPWADGDGRLPQAFRYLMRRNPPSLEHLDERWRLLCRGLLVEEIEDRWGADQVERWLRGESPAVAPRRGTARSSVIVPLTLAGRQFSGPDDLAAAMAGEPAVWDQVVGALRQPSSADHRLLRVWLRDCGLEEGAALLEEAGELKGGRPAPARAIRLLRVLAPGAPASFAGRAADAEGLVALAAAAEDELRALRGQLPTPQNASASAVLEDLCSAETIHELAGLEGGEKLNRLLDPWPGLVEEHKRLTSGVGPSAVPPPLTGAVPVALARARLLAALLSTPSAERLRQDAFAARADREARTQRWFAERAEERRPANQAGLALDLLLVDGRGLARSDARAEAGERSAGAARRASVWVLPLFAVGLTALALPWAVVDQAVDLRKNGPAVLGAVGTILGVGLLTLALKVRLRAPRPPEVALAILLLAVSLPMLLLFEFDIIRIVKLPGLPEGVGR